MAVYVILSFCLIKAILCNESESTELNRIEFAPLYETIIYSDIADIMKDYDNFANPPLEAIQSIPINDDISESDENIEDLLSEYQHYLEKAHKQRRNYLDMPRQPKGKNKVPLTPHEKYSKIYAKNNNRDDYYYNKNTFPFPLKPQFNTPKPQFNPPLDFLIPVNMIRSSPYYEPFKHRVDAVKVFPEEINSPDAKMLKLPPVMPSFAHEPIPSSCYCSSDTFPCECGCKQCLIAFEPSAHKKQADEESRSAKAISEGFSKEVRMADNTINIKVKVDVQFPQIQQGLGELIKNETNEKLDRQSFSKETNVNLPFPFFNFPFPVEMFGIKKPNKDSSPIHKITIHRKKKSKSGSNGKRHRKKVISFHDLKVEKLHAKQPSFYENISDYRQNSSQTNRVSDWYNYTQNLDQENTLSTDNFTNKRAQLPNANDTNTDTNTDSNIFLSFNISNNLDNITEDVHKSENSIETEYTKWVSNATTEEPLRRKREMTSPTTEALEFALTETQVQNVSVNLNETMKKSNKSSSDDDELLYWPNNSNGLALIESKNITSLILDRENSKEKLNLSAEMIRHDRNKALEEAIFGKVDWNDVGTVAPVFMSFMGKYVKGVLSFCSDSVCHSMKCGEKICVHRTCAPTDRTNNKGHCTGSNTDSVASMESIMDLPSNIATETVDILQQKMLGKLFGKATITIGSKCVTFTASKKIFTKVKCTPKELDASGHCTITKNTKIV